MTDLAHLDHELARLADGDRSVFSSVFGALSPIVQRFCRRRLGDGPDAADAAQIALEKIFAQLTSEGGQAEKARALLAVLKDA